jgi:DNA polymerase/3'-5' exonuclease PolX
MEKTNKEKVLNALEILRIRDLQSGNPKDKFSALAYTKAIKELKTLKAIESLKDVEDVKGVGKKIKEKIKEILETGELEAATKAMSELKIDLYQDLLKIFEVGPVKAKELINKHKITSIDDLRSKPELLNELQKMGLKYYDDSLERIPRSEMEEHEKKIVSHIKLPIECTIVGSYRRGLETSGDIDVLIKAPESYTKKQMKEVFDNLVKTYKDDNYIIDVAALGEKKFMGYVKLNSKSKARRLDILITPEKEYPYALLYFTGSDLFNVAFRKFALSKGYTINEHIMKKTKESVEDVPDMKTEKDIFKFLQLKYVEPSERKDETSIVEKIEKKTKVTLKNIVERKKKNII